MNKTKLKSCPFCGSENVYIEKHYPGFDGVVVECGSCYAKTAWCFTESAAIKTWNKRNTIARAEGRD